MKLLLYTYTLESALLNNLHKGCVYRSVLVNTPYFKNNAKSTKIKDIICKELSWIFLYSVYSIKETDVTLHTNASFIMLSVNYC